MNSRDNSRSLLLKMMHMFEMVAPLYDYSLEYDESDEMIPSLFGFDMQCFQDGGYISMSYGNVVRKIFLAVIIQMIKHNIIHIDISDILDMEPEQMDDLRYIIGGEKAGAVAGRMFHKLLHEYGYVHECNSYRSESFMDDIYDAVFSKEEDEADKCITDTFKSAVNQKDFIMVNENITNIKGLIMGMMSDDVVPETMEINTIYNSNLSKLLKKPITCMSECERRIFDAAGWLSDIIIGDDISSYWALEYNGEYMFPYCNWLHPCFNYRGYLYYSVKKDYRDNESCRIFCNPSD